VAQTTGCSANRYMAERYRFMSALSSVRVEAITTWSVCEVFACTVEVAAGNAYMQRGWRVGIRNGDGTSGHGSMLEN